ncbi:DNA/RNA non-specific endonuclease [Formosa haliotis]|uniref:DNA/RNA non-specific endonuclease n=1 Tax=Formosa haliotis TaxID=1555194 RepID=UPI000824A1CD|nr:DNA/RNA non-specific endonuclease [Formosa haliotis]
MNNEILFKGYDENFISGQTIPLPILNKEQKDDLVLDKNNNSIINYINYSLQLSAIHKFPFYTATNIDGLNFKKVPRRDNWRKDARIRKDLQWGLELYRAPKSNFDRGHMTKREDVQWGASIGLALNAADSTFYYTNSVPQHKDLNRAIWRSLEDYILHTETNANELKVSVFTGPVLSRQNPYFVTAINDEQIQIPSLFWKVVVFQKEDGNLYRVAFIMSQNKLLLNDGIIEELERDDLLFMQFDDSATYQVNVSLVEEITGLEFPVAMDSYSDDRSIKLVLNEVDIDPDLESLSIENELGFVIEHIYL